MSYLLLASRSICSFTSNRLGWGSSSWLVPNSGRPSHLHFIPRCLDSTSGLTTLRLCAVTGDTNARTTYRFVGAINLCTSHVFRSLLVACYPPEGWESNLQDAFASSLFVGKDWPKVNCYFSLHFLLSGPLSSIDNSISLCYQSINHYANIDSNILVVL